MVYCFDFDGTLAITQGNDYPNSQPDRKAIEKVNKLVDTGHTIKIFTARGTTSGKDWYALTQKQIDEWGIKCHELIMGKPHSDCYIDDKGMNVKEWLAQN
jgi:hypothetical protein